MRPIATAVPPPFRCADAPWGRGLSTAPLAPGPRPALRRGSHRGGLWALCWTFLRTSLPVLGVLSALGPARLPAQFPGQVEVDNPEFRGIVYSPKSDGVQGLGQALAPLGDLDGDGRSEILVAAEGAPGGTGRVFIVRSGPRSPLRRTLPGPEDSAIELRSGLSAPDGFGSFVASAGDVDGDGLEDLLVGAPRAALDGFAPGAVYLIFGRSPWPRALTLDLFSSGVRVLVLAEPSGTLGRAGCGVGDLDGDGFADLLLGLPDAPGAPGGERERTGALRLVFGGPNLRGEGGLLPLDGPSPPRGVAVAGVDPGDQLGLAVAAIGDLDGDGRGDALAGAPGRGVGGTVYVIFGRSDLASGIDLSAPDGGAVVELSSSLPGAELGRSLAAGADLTGDGAPDLLLGAPGTVRDGAPGGAALVVAGGGALRGAGLGLVRVPRPGDGELRGVRGSGTGGAVAIVPDLNGDGVAEALVAAPAERTGRGSVFFLLGGPGLASRIFLEELAPPAGSVFSATLPDTGLGASVAAVGLRNAEGTGSLLLGAPLAPQRTLPPGRIFEVFLPEPPGSEAPRNLAAELVPGGRVVLTWNIPRIYEALRIYRDGAPVSPRLPGSYLRYADPDPGSGLHVYFVEADGDPRLRSGTAQVIVRPSSVRDLVCAQVEGSLLVRLRWAPGDLYKALRVDLDGIPASGLLPPTTTGFELAVTPGHHLIAVLDPLAQPGAPPAVCEVDASAPELPEIRGLTCTELETRRVRLSWTPAPAYGAYELRRGGLPLAIVTGASTFVDENVPAGTLAYTLRGINQSLHRGPESTCALRASEPGPLVLRGRVLWSGGGVARRGLVSLVGGATGVAQLDGAGRFELEVPTPGSYRLRVVVAVDARPFETRGLLLAGPLASALATARTDESVEIALAPPILVVAAEQPEGAGLDPRARWRPLVDRVGSSAILSLLQTPARVTPGARAIAAAVDELLLELEEQVGAPSRIDMICYGSAGLQARAYLAGSSSAPVGKLILLGCPNLGTARAHVEARAEFSGRPARPLEGGDGAAGVSFAGAAEETPEFLLHFNSEVRSVGGTEVHLVAGDRGLDRLDAVLGCDDHDDRVCVESALGGVPGAMLHRVAESHEALGRGALSLTLLLDEILGLDGPRAGGGAAGEPAGEVGGDGGAGAGDEAKAAGGAGAGDPDGPPDEEGAGGAGATSHASGVYTGVLEPGDSGIFPLGSDTSESIIIILNSELPGGLQFRVRTPSGQVVDPTTAASLGIAEYYTYGDGEGHELQAYRFHAADVGAYEVLLDNDPANAAIRFTLEAYVESDLALDAVLDPGELELEGEGRLVVAALEKGLPDPGASIEARVLRPDGSIDVLELLDDGLDGDDAPADGVFTVRLASRSQPGIHEVEVSADGLLAGGIPYHRELTTRFQVRSDAAALGAAFNSGVDDADADGLYESLWVDGALRAFEPGLFLVLGELSSDEGALLATGGILLTLEEPGEFGFRVHFAGDLLQDSRESGPYHLSRVIVLDGSASLVPADEVFPDYRTAAYEWSVFGVRPPVVERELKADSNSDGRIDIADAVGILAYLFSGGGAVTCLDASDANRDGAVALSDAVYILQYLFSGGPPPVAPFPGCEAVGALDCVRPACAAP